VLFKEERVLFAVDFPADALVQASMRSLPSACGPFDGQPMAEWIRSYRTLEALDFDVLVGGHGTVAFQKQDIREGREYFEYLQQEVAGAMARGLSLAQMREQLTLDRYKDWAHYAPLRVFNIEAAYHNLSLYK
jgi:glyoxylase-like metal-dependent hydrolase (beta-lactamase superfamily II)